MYMRVYHIASYRPYTTHPAVNSYRANYIKTIIGNNAYMKSFTAATLFLRTSTIAIQFIKIFSRIMHDAWLNGVLKTSEY